MRSTVLHAPGDIRVEDRDDPKIVAPTDAIIRVSATCVCGSDLWPYRGVDAGERPTPMGHEYVGIVEEVGSEVDHVKPGPVRGRIVLRLRQHVRDLPGRLSDAPACTVRFIGANGAQAEFLRIPCADGTLVATPEHPARRPGARACSPPPT